MGRENKANHREPNVHLIRLFGRALLSENLVDKEGGFSRGIIRLIELKHLRGGAGQESHQAREGIGLTSK